MNCKDTKIDAGYCFKLKSDTVNSLVSIGEPSIAPLVDLVVKLDIEVGYSQEHIFYNDLKDPIANALSDLGESFPRTLINHIIKKLKKKDNFTGRYANSFAAILGNLYSTRYDEKVLRVLFDIAYESQGGEGNTPNWNEDAIHAIRRILYFQKHQSYWVGDKLNELTKLSPPEGISNAILIAIEEFESKKRESIKK